MNDKTSIKDVYMNQLLLKNFGLLNFLDHSLALNKTLKEKDST